MFRHYITPSSDVVLVEPPDALANAAQTRLENELSQKVLKFEKRLSETDPVSGAPRYGEGMTAKVRAGTQTSYRRMDAALKRKRDVPRCSSFRAAMSLLTRGGVALRRAASRRTNDP